MKTRPNKREKIDLKEFKQLQPVYSKSAEGLVYTMYPDIVNEGSHHFIIQVTRKKTRRILFWKFSQTRTICVFKITLRNREDRINWAKSGTWAWMNALEPTTPSFSCIQNNDTKRDWI